MVQASQTRVRPFQTTVQASQTRVRPFQTTVQPSTTGVQASQTRVRAGRSTLSDDEAALSLKAQALARPRVRLAGRISDIVRWADKNDPRLRGGCGVVLGDRAPVR